jgi:hypothetical protein
MSITLHQQSKLHLEGPARRTPTHTAIAPWHLVRTDNKRLARVNLMRDMLSRLHYAGRISNWFSPTPRSCSNIQPIA